MDENIYSLLLKSATGLTLLGTLRYSIDFATALDASADWQQQAATIGGVVYPARGSITIPFLTGLQPVPLSGFAIYVQMGQPLLNWFYSEDAARGLTVQFNPIGFERIAGGLLSQLPNSNVVEYAFLGRRIALPA